MPLMIIRTSVDLPETQKEALLKAASQVLVNAGKPESHVMVMLEKVDAIMGGKVGPAALVEVRSMVGLTPAFNHTVAETLCPVLQETLKITGHDIYLNFITVPVSAWGWDHGIVAWKHDLQKWVVE